MKEHIIRVNGKIKGYNVKLIDEHELLIEIDSDEFNPKKGDFCVDKEGIIFIGGWEEDNYSISELCYLENNKLDINGSVWIFDKSECRYATEEEKQKLLKALEDAHYKYDEETKEIVPIKWRADHSNFYYYLDSNFDIVSAIDNYSDADNDRFKYNNYFISFELAQFAQEKAIKLFSELNKFHQ